MSPGQSGPGTSGFDLVEYACCASKPLGRHQAASAYARSDAGASHRSPWRRSECGDRTQQPRISGAECATPARTVVWRQSKAFRPNLLCAERLMANRASECSTRFMSTVILKLSIVLAGSLAVMEPTAVIESGAAGDNGKVPPGDAAEYLAGSRFPARPPDSSLVDSAPVLDRFVRAASPNPRTNAVALPDTVRSRIVYERASAAALSSESAQRRRIFRDLGARFSAFTPRCGGVNGKQKSEGRAKWEIEGSDRGDRLLKKPRSTGKRCGASKICISHRVPGIKSAESRRRVNCSQSPVAAFDVAPEAKVSCCAKGRLAIRNNGFAH